jgi:hypothetical protein
MERFFSQACRRYAMSVKKIYISYLTARKAGHTIIYFYQHIVPNGTKIERKHFYLNITFFTPYLSGWGGREYLWRNPNRFASLRLVIFNPSDSGYWWTMENCDNAVCERSWVLLIITKMNIVQYIISAADSSRKDTLRGDGFVHCPEGIHINRTEYRQARFIPQRGKPYQ